MSVVDNAVQMSKYTKACNLVVLGKLVAIRQVQMRESKCKKISIVLNSNVKVPNFIFDEIVLDIGSHPVGLRLLNVLAPDHGLADDAVC